MTRRIQNVLAPEWMVTFTGCAALSTSLLATTLAGASLAAQPLATQPLAAQPLVEAAQEGQAQESPVTDIDVQAADESTVIVTGVAPPAEHEEEVAVAEKQKPRVEIALLLDTSGSMNGLINQAQTQLWKIVNQFELVRCGGERPDVYVALYEYGNSGLDAQSGYIRQVVTLTSDLDKISEELFALKTNGGSEHCGQVIQRAVADLPWTDRKGVMKSLFIAGNEPFTQGPIDYHDACRAAADKNITVSTIHCGGYEEGVNGMWADGALLADGTYMNIDQDQAVAEIPTPQDAELARLSQELNGTYIAYGRTAERGEALARQAAQDRNAAQAQPAAAASRAATKAGANYRNAHWDLVDALEEKQVELEKLDKEQLPEALRKLSVDELHSHVSENGKKRAEIQKKIKELSAERSRFLADARANDATAAPADASLEAAVSGAIEAQAAEAGFEVAPE